MSKALADLFTAANQATARDTVVTLASQAATALADAEGICLMAARQDRCVFTVAKDPRPFTMRLEGSLQQLMSAIPRHLVRLHEAGPRDVLRLPNGTVQRFATILLLPIAAASGWSTLGVFWSQPHRPTTDESHALHILSGGLSLALQLQQKEEELTRSAQRQKRLTTELQHRVRNILAFVRSIVRRTGETAESAEEFALHLEARISALARTQGTLTMAGTTGVELEELVRAEMTATAIRDDRLNVSGPPIRLHAKGAETMAMALHELATNSLKFGALTTSQGRITVHWQIDWAMSPPRLRVSWIETGVKIAALAPRRRGFGQELIEHTLPYQLNAETSFSFLPGGLHCVIDLPLNERTSMPSHAVDGDDGHGTSNIGR